MATLNEDEFRLSIEWSLHDLRIENGLTLTIARDNIGDGDAPSPSSTRQIVFRNPACWAFVNMSQMWQYFTEVDCPPVLVRSPHENAETYIPGLKINTELQGSWSRWRVTTWSDVVDVISREDPNIVVI